MHCIQANTCIVFIVIRTLYAMQTCIVCNTNMDCTVRNVIYTLICEHTYLGETVNFRSRMNTIDK